MANNLILILGNCSEPDRYVIDRCAVQRGLVTRYVSRAQWQEWDYSWDSAIGYLSFLPYSSSTLLDLFALLPVGSGQMPLCFQAVDLYDSTISDTLITGSFIMPVSAVAMGTILSSIELQASLLEQNMALVNEVNRYRKEKNRLMNIGLALSSEQDLDSLLEWILEEALSITLADAGSIYIRENIGAGEGYTNRLLFKVTQNKSVDISKGEKQDPLPISENTIAGHVALTGKPLRIDDVGRLDADVPYSWGRGFVRRFGYQIKSMLAVPLKNLQGEVVGVLQLMNKKLSTAVRLSDSDAVRDHALAFSHSDEDTVMSIGSLAAVSIERAQLTSNIQHLFEGFLSSSVAAIDERDRVTSGHSKRVADYAMSFVDAINTESQGVFADVQFSLERKQQFEFAALLHDIGKIGVPEALLTKDLRLPAGEIAALGARFEIIRIQMKLTGGTCGWPHEEALEEDWLFLQKVNASGFLSDDDFKRLSALRDKTYATHDNPSALLISDSEWEHLSIRQGNLTPIERDLINSHAQATRRILSKIPWTKEMRLIPSIACHHHEKIDGSGYPDGLSGDAISLESRILAVVDIYEALVAQDRPYKPRMPYTKALEILRFEASKNRLDSDIVEFFIDHNIYKIFFTETN